MISIKGYILKSDKQVLMISSDSILSASVLNDNIMVYAIVDTNDVEGRPYEFRMFYTDQKIDTDLIGYSFIGTGKIAGDNRNIHIFYKPLTSMDL